MSDQSKPEVPPRRPAKWRRGLARARDWYEWARDGREPQTRNRTLIRFLTRHSDAPPIRVDVDATPQQLAQLTARVEETWSGLGESEPHWSVLTMEQYRSESIAVTRDMFYATGEESYRSVERAFARNNIALSSLKSVLDLGCGVGRVSSAFARHEHEVVAADISPAHIEMANAYFRENEIKAVETRRLSRIDDINLLPEVDLVFSLIVLQHNPPPVIAQMLRKALGRVRPGGCAYFQVPTYCTGYHYDVALDASLATARGMEMHVLPQREVFRIIDELGFVALETRQDGGVGDTNFESVTFVAKRRHDTRYPVQAA